MTDEKKYEPAEFPTAPGPGKTALASYIQTIGRGLRVIEHTAELVSQDGYKHYKLLDTEGGTITGRRFSDSEPEPQRLPLTVGLGGGKTRALMIANAKDYIAQTRHGRDVMIALAQDRKDAGSIPGNPLPEILIWDEAHFTDGRPPEYSRWEAIDYASVESRITADMFRDAMAKASEPRDPAKYLSYEELRRLSRQRIPTSGVNQSIYLRSFEPAAPAIVGKSKKHRAKAIAGRKAKRKNRK